MKALLVPRKGAKILWTHWPRYRVWRE